MHAQGYVLEAPRAPLVAKALEIVAHTDDDVVVEVRACGLCHTDLGFANGSVAPKHALPIVLGHEITGVVVEALGPSARWIGRQVLVPAVIPCGECAFCSAGRGNACPKQKMPGNDIDGGFATHVVVPARALVPLDDRPASISLDSLSVVADAVSTAYQAVRRSGLARGDIAFVVGAGGVGGYVAQIVRALGGEVVVCDVQPTRLEALAAFGVLRGVDVRERDARDVRKEVHGVANERGIASFRWRVFECSGTTAGQQLAFTLLSQAATLVLVGYTREPVTVRLSNLMAFDATVRGTWGCPIEAYPEVLSLIYSGAVVVEPSIERAPMSQLNTLLDDLSHHRLSRRMVLDPRA